MVEATVERASVGHSGVVRITHWITLLCFVALVVSGYVITMTHPRLYWGDAGNLDMPAWITLPIERRLGESGWGRSLHFLGAWILVPTGIVYMLWGMRVRHFSLHLFPRREQLATLQWRQEVRAQLRWRIEKRGEAPNYGLLQRSAYAVVVFLLVPLVVLTGLTLSPAITAAYPFLLSLFGGFQSARTIHFLDALLLLLFVIGHVTMVVRSGFRHQIRSMTLGERSYGHHGNLAPETAGDGR